MVRGEIYGALLRRLNSGITYINCDRVASEIEDDDDDVAKVMSELWDVSLTRRINKNEYELICSVDQLKSYILSQEELTGEKAPHGEFDASGDMPISKSVLESSLWSAMPEKESEKPSSIEDFFNRRRERQNNAFESRRRHLSSMLDDDDDDDEEDDENRRALILSSISKFPNVNMENKTFDLHMPIGFPNSEIKLSMGWGVDEEGDYYLTDNETFYKYLMEQISVEDFPERDLLIPAIINRLTKSSSLTSKGNSIANYLTDVDDENDFIKDINEIIASNTASVMAIEDMLKPVRESKDNPTEYIEKKISEFLSDYDIVKDFRPSFSRRGMERGSMGVIKSIAAIDPRITKSGAVDIANRIKGMIMEDIDKIDQYRAIIEVITELNCMADKVFWAIKAEGYFR